MFGDAMAAYVLSQLAEPTAPVEPLFIKNRDRMFPQLLNRIFMKERDVYRGRSVGSGPRFSATLTCRLTSDRQRQE